ncbi:MAG: ATP-binding protein [Eubacteriales bacterium]|nr:ATP-binding protein [Clostridiales bacterium]MDY5836416.1 ATP-binding protein [Eubacteriales bacterium]
MFKLSDSLFFRRIISILILSLLVWALATNALFTMISRPLLVANRSKDLFPQAHWIAEQAGPYFLKEDELVENMVNISYNFFNVWTIVNFADGRSLATPLPDKLSQEVKDNILEQALYLNQDYLDSFPAQGLDEAGYALEDGIQAEDPKLQEFLQGKHGTIVLKSTNDEYLFVLVPIYSQEFSQLSRRPLGTVIMIQPLAEFNLSISSLNLSLFLASVGCGLLLLLPAVYSTRRLVQPLHNIRKVAMSITKGDFSQSVSFNPDKHDEITDLAKSINHMSESLSRSLAALNLERKQLKEIVDGISEGIIAVDNTGKITQTNEIIWELFQRNKDFYTAEDLVASVGLEPLFRLCLDQGQEVSEHIQLGDDKKIIQASINPIFDHKHNVSAAVGLFRDVTKSTRLEQTRRDYIANVSHELRTPITAMRALIEPLRDGMVKSEEDKQRYYDIILHETLRLSRLIDDMLELSRLQSGTSFIEQGPINLKIFLDHLAPQMDLMTQEKSIQFQVQGMDQDLATIWGNEDRIEQILLTYLDNALKFTPEGGLIILRARPTPQKMFLEIEDNGAGIAPEDIPYVFERFYKADKAHNEAGTGLGLSIAKALAEQLKMTVSVRSTQGQGAVFSLGIQYAADVMQKETHMKEVFDFSDAETGETND